VTIIRENNDGDNFGTFAQLLSRLLDVAELFYQLLSDDLLLKQQRAEEARMNSEQTLYMENDFGWEFQEEKR
jgi:hypothetical protein